MPQEPFKHPALTPLVDSSVGISPELLALFYDNSEIESSDGSKEKSEARAKIGGKRKKKQAPNSKGSVKPGGNDGQKRPRLVIDLREEDNKDSKDSEKGN